MTITQTDRTVFNIRYGVWKAENKNTLSDEEKEIALHLWKEEKAKGNDYDPRRLCSFVNQTNTRRAATHAKATA